MPHLVLDKEGFVTATYKGQKVCPLQPPENGEVVCVHDEYWVETNQILESGKRVKYAQGFIIEMEQPIKTVATVDSVAESRKKKLIEAGAITHVRDEDDKDTGVYTPVGLRHLDIAVLYLDGDLKPSDMIYVRNNKTHNEDRISVQQWKDSLKETFDLRQSLRAQEQVIRDQIAAIYDDPKKTDENKITEIDAIVVSMEEVVINGK